MCSKLFYVLCPKSRIQLGSFFSFILFIYILIKILILDVLAMILPNNFTKYYRLNRSVQIVCQ